MKKKAASRKRASQALARRGSYPGDTFAPGFNPPRVDVLPPATMPGHIATAPAALTEEMILGQYGKIEIKITAKEEAILAREVRVADVRMKPSGQPYLSHPTYTRWFNEAFGRLSWSIVPLAKPMQTPKGVAVPYMLYIHGKPAAFAIGEQDYFEGNREQTWGDAIEATVASGLRRCAKRMGVGLELWDKAWIDEYVRDHCLCVQVIKNRRDGDHWVKKAAYEWRRRVDAPLPNEVGEKKPGEQAEEELDQPQRAARDEERTRRPQPARSVGTHAASGEKITEKQRGRLWAIVKNSGRNEEVVHQWLEQGYGVTSFNDVRRIDYDAVCSAVEADGPLPRGRA